MKNRYFLIFKVGFFLLFSPLLIGQTWIENATEEDGRINFSKAQQAFEIYWKDKQIDKGKGYKVFKRWEHYWESRLDEKGYIPPPGLIAREWERYLSNHNETKSRMSSNWSNLGPISNTTGYGGIGRISAIAFDPSNINNIWIGTPGGGLWKSTDNGNTWTTNTDFNLAHLGVSGIIIDPNNSSIMYIATGDADAGDTYSIGVLKSLDGGNTWSTTGLNWTASNNRRIYRLVMDPSDPNTLVAATSNGIYRTTNAGSTWTQERTGVHQDMVAHPDVSKNVFYACTSTQVLKSIDNGDNWTVVYTLSSTNRLALAVTPANTAYLYVLASKSSGSGFHSLSQSVDEGGTFMVKSTTPNILGYEIDGSDTDGQGWYDLCITADPNVANTIYIGGVNIWKSTNAGVNWTLNTFWYNAGYPTVHADKHVFAWQSNSNLWNGNDGGVYFTSNGGTSWTDKSVGLVNSQIYRIGISESDSKVIVGLQDNGTKLRNTSGNWSDILGGDGMNCLIHPTNSNIMYGAIQNGELRRSTNGGSSWTDISNNIASNLSGAWITPYELDPTNPSTIYAAYAHLYKSTDQGNSWTIIGNSTNIGTSNKTILEVCKTNSNYIYVGTSSRISRTTNGGLTWSTIFLPGNISALQVHPTKPNTIWVTRSGYTSGSKVFKSINGGRTWTNISGTLPNLPFNTIVHDDDLHESIYVGSDVGVFYINNDLSDWELFSNNLPNVEIFDLDIDYTENKIYAATYGRGVWYSDLNSPNLVCNAPVDVVAKPRYRSFIIEWEAVPSASYQYVVTTSATPPSTGTPVTGSSVVVNNLNHNTDYYIHVRTQCSSGNSIWKTIQSRTALSCGDVFTDPGGPNSNYSNNAYVVNTICPQSSNYYANVSITGFNTEANYDGLYFYNGDLNDNPLPSSAGILSSGYPEGSYHGSLTPPSTIYSTNQGSGCITTLFRSDGSATASGWNSTSIGCCTNIVTSVNDSGNGSLRAAIACAPSNDQIIISNSMQDQTIVLSGGPIIANSNFSLAPNTLLNLKVTGGTGAIFQINNNVNGEIANLTLQAANISGTRVIQNNGNLILKNIIIKDANLNSSNGASINNLGNLNIMETLLLIP